MIALIISSVWAALSATQAVDSNAAYATLMPMMKFVVPFIIGVTLIDTEQRSRQLLWIIVIAMGYVGFEMNLEYWRGFNIAGEGFGGMDNNCFGVALVSTIGPAIALGLGAKGWIERGVAGACAALILHTTLLTFSRGAMVGLLAVGATAFIIMPKRPSTSRRWPLSVSSRSGLPVRSSWRATPRQWPTRSSVTTRQRAAWRCGPTASS